MKHFLLIICFMAVSISCVGEEKMNYNHLTKEEEHVILNKGTERPFSGKYVNHKENGIYTCKRCDTPLYTSNSKFDSRSGWPSFDENSFNNVKQLPDTDGMRTEIVCKNCGAHLGHIFTGERFTPKNVRHCVNSISLKFTPKQHAYFAGGCFWGVEHFFKEAKGVTNTQVGYMGGETTQPTYKEVSYLNTGHAETLKVSFNPEETSFKELAMLFFEIHDPTQINRQGPDIGAQYRSAIFYTNDKQKKIAEKLIKRLEEKGFKVATALQKANKFWKAEEYHQDYYGKKGGTPYCHARVKRF